MGALRAERDALNGMVEHAEYGWMEHEGNRVGHSACGLTAEGAREHCFTTCVCIALIYGAAMTCVHKQGEFWAVQRKLFSTNFHMFKVKFAKITKTPSPKDNAYKLFICSEDNMDDVIIGVVRVLYGALSFLQLDTVCIKFTTCLKPRQRISQIRGAASQNAAFV